MRLENEFKSILDEAFETRFQGWEKLSPLDPLKVFTESMALSLAEIERRQSRLMETVLDSLPSLFSFKRRQATPSTVLFQAKLLPSVTEASVLHAGTEMTFTTANGAYVARVAKDTRLVPAEITSKELEANCVKLRLYTRAPLTEISLTYLPESAASATCDDYSLTVTEPGQTPYVIHREAVELEDGTSSFTQTGTIMLRARRGQALELADQGTEIELAFYFREAAARGEFLLNGVLLEMTARSEDATLGKLKGLAWEEMPLSETLLSIPNQVALALPTGKTVSVHRLDNELLKLRLSDPTRFNGGFFYNAAHHSLVFPGAFALFEAVEGAVEVRAEKLERLCELTAEVSSLDDLGDATTDRPISGNPKFQAVAVVTRGTSRESESDYLKRFYSMIRSAQISPLPEPGVFAESLQDKIAAVHPSLRLVEVDINRGSKEVIVFLLAAPTEYDPLPYPSSEVTNEVAQLLERIVPLDYQWRLEHFSKREIQLSLSLEASLDDNRAGAISEASLNTRAGTRVRDLFSPDWTAGRNRLGLNSLMSSLKLRLTETEADGSELHPEEISHLDLRAQEATTGVFLEEIERQLGEILVPMITVDVAITRAGDTERVISETRLHRRTKR